MEFVSNITQIISLVTVLLGGLIFIWKVSGNLNSTLTNLNNSTDRLNTHLVKVEEEVDENTDKIANHETRITVLEKLQDKE